MRRPLIAGNWKMNTDREAASKLASGISGRAGEVLGADLLVCPPSPYLSLVQEALEDGTQGSNSVALGAQNMHQEAKGAFTGEISASMLKDVGAQFVILGHSERRHIFGETNAQISQKTHAALNAELTPIVCVGELLEDRDAGNTSTVIRAQFEGSLAGVTSEEIALVVLAYEPAWAIGTGKVASPEQAEEVHADLRKMLVERYNSMIAGTIRILYGGSVKPDNAGELLSQPNVDGALIGGASLKVDDFLGIALAAGSA